jgi:hypothetical protein
LYFAEKAFTKNLYCSLLFRPEMVRLNCGVRCCWEAPADRLMGSACRTVTCGEGGGQVGGKRGGDRGREGFLEQKYHHQQDSNTRQPY